MLNLPRPGHVIARDNGSLTPLIAVDELPDMVQISDVPVTLHAADTTNTISLGLTPRTPAATSQLAMVPVATSSTAIASAMKIGCLAANTIDHLPRQADVSATGAIERQSQ